MSVEESDRDYSAAHDYPAMINSGDVDATLESLVHLIEASGENLGLSVLLLLPGGAIHGRLVNKARWYRDWYAGISAAGPGADSLTRFFRAVNESAGKLAEDGSLLDHTGSYAHILDGCLISPQGQTNRMPWRVRLDRVSAWSLGSTPENP